MPIVLITLAVGLAGGYWLCRMQLRGKWSLAENEILSLTAERNHYRYMLENLPEPEKVFIPGCNKCLSAKSVLGFNDFGNIHPPVYEGGLERWKELN